MNDFDEPGDRAAKARFGVTPWTDVTLAQQGASSASRSALERLCRLYWFPVYAHVRQRGFGPHEAEDLTQEFFSLLIEKNYLEAADRRRGRFRSFLLVAVNRFLVNAYHRDRALKRGGGQIIVMRSPRNQGTRSGPSRTVSSSMGTSVAPAASANQISSTEES